MAEVREGIAFASVVLLAAVFLVSGGAKVIAGTFSLDLENYQIVPAALVMPIARTLPWVELATGASLLAWNRSYVPALTAALLLATFTLTVSITLLRGLRVSCGCRANGKQVSWALAITNLLLLMLAVAAASDPPTSLVSWLLADEVLAGVQLPALLVLAVCTSLWRVVSVWGRVYRRIGSSDPSAPIVPISIGQDGLAAELRRAS